ncbi:MAG: helix-turn-helix domain-containing protein [Hyphomicrobiales bacterium]
MDDAHNKLFGEILQKARNAKGLSLSEAARLLGVPKNTLWRWENDETRIYAGKLVAIAATYGFSASSLFNGEIVIAPTQMDYDRLGVVVEHIERIIQDTNIRPKPEAVRTAVVEVLKVETNRVLESKRSEFDPSRYDGMINGILSQ